MSCAVIEPNSTYIPGSANERWRPLATPPVMNHSTVGPDGAFTCEGATLLRLCRCKCASGKVCCLGLCRSGIGSQRQKIVL